MSTEQLDSKVIQNNVSPKGTLQRYNDVVVNVRTILGGFRQELTIFNELVMKSINVLQKLEILVEPTEKKMSTLADCIDKQLAHFVEVEVCEAAMMEGAISSEQCVSEVKQKNVSIKETIQQQNDILLDVRISFPGIGQGIIILEETMEKSYDVLQKTKDRMVSNDNTFSIFSDDLKKRLDQLAEFCEATVEGTTSAEQSNAEVMLKNFLTKEQVKLLNHVLVTYDDRFHSFRTAITTSLETTGKRICVLKKMREKIILDECKLSNLANGCQKSLDQSDGCESCKAAKEEKIAEQFDFKVMQKNVMSKEEVQLQDDLLLIVRTNFIPIRQNIALFEKTMKKNNGWLHLLIEEIASAENELSIHIVEIQKQLSHLVEDEVEVCEAVKAMELSPGKVIAHYPKDESVFV